MLSSPKSSLKSRTRFILTTGFVGLLLAGTPGAFAERLGGAYRGPEDLKAAQDDSAANDSTASSGGETQSGTSTDSGGSSGDSGGGGMGDGGGDTGGGGGGTPEGGGGDTGGGDSGGGDSMGGGGDSGGSTAPSSGGPSAGGGGGGGASVGGGGPGGGKGKSAVQDQLSVVSWYFEHNREHFLWQAVQGREQSIRAPRFSTPAALATAKIEKREVSSVTTEDRERIFDVLTKNTLAQEDVVRDAAVIALGKIGTPDAVRLLRERLKTESKADIKEDICIALGIARTPEAVDALIEVVRTGKGRIVSFALLSLGLTRSPEKAGPVLLEFFTNGQRSSKSSKDGLAAAALSLGALKYAEAEKALIHACNTKSMAEVVKVHAIHALGEIGTPTARKAIEGYLDGSLEVSRAAVLALGNFPDASVAKTLSGKEGVGRASDQLAAGFACMSLAQVLAGMPDTEWKKFPDELRTVATEPAKAAVKAQYANLALTLVPGGIDQELRNYYAAALSDKKLNADTGSSVAMACGLGDVAGVEGQIEAIAKDAGADPKLRGYMSLALGLSPDQKKAVLTLRKIYQENDNPDVRRGCLFGIGLAGDRKDVQFLLDAIVQTPKDKPFAGYTRGAAVIALGLLRDGESVQRIQGLLSNPDAHVRAYAIAALGYLADKDPAPVLPELFRHANFRLEFATLATAMRNL